MNRYEKLKEFFVTHASRYNLVLNNNNELKIVSYSMNDEVYGIQNFFIGDLHGFKLVLKKGRNSFFDQRFRKRILELNQSEYYKTNRGVIDKIILGFEIEILERRYLVQEFLRWKNAYQLLRNPIVGSEEKYELLNHALDFCRSLEVVGLEAENISDECSRIASFFEKSNGSARIRNFEIKNGAWKIINKNRVGGVKIGLIHNDLVPSNFLIKAEEYRVLDWEYWDISFSIFNFFDVVLSFGSLIFSPPFSKRNKSDYWEVFSDRGRKKKVKFIKICGEYCERVAYLKISPDVAEKLFLLYLMNKCVCQYRVYDAHFSFDNFWISLLNEYYRYSKYFLEFWTRLINWEKL